MFFFYDYSIFLIIPGIILSIWASSYVKSTFSKYSRIPTKSRFSGYDTAVRVLRYYDVDGITIRRTRGSLTDHYDPRTKCLALSESVYGSVSVAAAGVSAHECGHATQHDRKYFPLTLRKLLVPVTNIGSILALPIALIGILIEWAGGTAIGETIVSIGILAYSLTFVFSLITLPVELNASKRAKCALVATGVLDRDESEMAGRVLRAAALTYVANLAVTFLYLLRFLIIIGRFRRRD